MRKELENIYENLFNNYFSQTAPAEFVQHQEAVLSIASLIRSEIQTMEDTYQKANYLNPVRIRSDAKYFLQLVFHQMVAIPIINEGIPSNQGDLRSFIQSDVKRIIDAGYKEKAYAMSKEITAHTILAALDKNWNQLNISNFTLWND